MSDIASELARVTGAFAQPTLTLLHQRQAPVVITIFRQAFGRDNRPVPTSRLHTQVEQYLAELRRGGAHADLPEGSGRELCQRWMRGRWLVRSLDETDQEVYTLTSYAQQAVELVKQLSRERATLSEHRIATIVSSVRRFNSEANPDPATRVAILNEEIARLQSERDRLVDGERIEPPSDDYMAEGYTELLSLVSALPSDFARVEERFTQIRAEILAAFRAEDRPPGEVIDEYLARADDLMTATPEGRAFEGAFALLRDDAMITQLREDLGGLLEHPASDRILAEQDRAELRSTVRLVRDGLDRVLSQRSRVTATLKDYIVSRDAARDRELERTLRQIEAELVTWMDRTGPRTTLDLDLLPERSAALTLRERFYDPADAIAPERLEESDEDQAAPVLPELLAQGGPSLGDLRERLSRSEAGTLGEFFGTLEPRLRRPVEIFGLLHLAAQDTPDDLDHHAAGAVADAADPPPGTSETYETVRPDGSRRAFAVPRHPVPRLDKLGVRGAESRLDELGVRGAESGLDELGVRGDTPGVREPAPTPTTPTPQESDA